MWRPHCKIISGSPYVAIGSGMTACAGKVCPAPPNVCVQLLPRQAVRYVSPAGPKAACVPLPAARRASPQGALPSMTQPEPAHRRIRGRTLRPARAA